MVTTSGRGPEPVATDSTDPRRRTVPVPMWSPANASQEVLELLEALFETSHPPPETHPARHRRTCRTQRVQAGPRPGGNVSVESKKVWGVRSAPASTVQQQGPPSTGHNVPALADSVHTHAQTRPATQRPPGGVLRVRLRQAQVPRECLHVNACRPDGRSGFPLSEKDVPAHLGTGIVMDRRQLPLPRHGRNHPGRPSGTTSEATGDVAGKSGSADRERSSACTDFMEQHQPHRPTTSPGSDRRSPGDHPFPRLLLSRVTDIRSPG
jgi:hypothetical protein